MKDQKKYDAIKSYSWTHYIREKLVFAIDQFQKFLLALKSNRFILIGFWLSIANVFGGLLAYIHQVLVGRMLTPAEFALFGAIMGLSTFVSSPVASLSLLVARKISKLRAAGDTTGVRKLYIMSQKWSLAGGMAFVVLVWFISEDLQYYLKSSSLIPIWLLAGYVIMVAMYAINIGYFQGNQHFAWLAWINIGSGSLKIGCTVFLVSLGLGVAGAIGGVFLASICIWAVGFIWILLQRSKASESQSTTIDTSSNTVSFVPVLAANVAFAALTQLDIVLVNWYFLPSESGIYMSAAVLGKAVLYLPGGLVMALFPITAANHASNRSSTKVLLQAIVFTIFMCLSICVFYYIFGSQLVSFFYGDSYKGGGELLRVYGFAVLPMALVMLAEHYLIAMDRVLFVWLIIIMAPVQILAIHFLHDNLTQVILVMGLCGTMLVIAGYSIMYFGPRDKWSNEDG